MFVAGSRAAAMPACPAERERLLACLPLLLLLRLLLLLVLRLLLWILLLLLVLFFLLLLLLLLHAASLHPVVASSSAVMAWKFRTLLNGEMVCVCGFEAHSPNPPWNHVRLYMYAYVQHYVHAVQASQTAGEPQYIANNGEPQKRE
jgi:hypothetical protein